MREEPAIPHQKLRACLLQEYGLSAAAIYFLPIGADTNAGVYRVRDDQGVTYFLKIKSVAIYPPSCLVSRFLADQGIDPVIAPIPTKTQALWTHVGDWTAVLYPYVEGSTGWKDITDTHWSEAGRIFRRIHDIAPPPSGFAAIRTESFDTSGYEQSFQKLAADLEDADGGDRIRLGLRSAWRNHRPTINALLASMNELAAILAAQSLSQVICHADLHPGNLLRDRSGHVFVVDWDDVMLAPRERDFIFVGEPAAPAGGSPFFKGYGPVAVNWLAVTYYRCERVVTDLIEDARNVFRTDLGEETRDQALRFFGESLTGRNLEAARAAAAHIAPELSPFAARGDSA